MRYNIKLFSLCFFLIIFQIYFYFKIKFLIFKECEYNLLQFYIIIHYNHLKIKYIKKIIDVIFCIINLTTKNKKILFIYQLKLSSPYIQTRKLLLH